MAEIPEDFKHLVGRVETALRAMKVVIVTAAPTINDIEQRHRAQLRTIAATASELKGQ